jgi:LmbE family N-acetylglucosaminyl deacetylase
MKKQPWIFLSPHFDDVALSCGGLVWELARQGNEVEIWTIMGGFPPDENFSDFARQNHRTWKMSGKEAIHKRREEDRAACEIMGAKPRHFDWLDVIYRRNPDTGKPIVNNNDDLFGEPPESDLISEIAKMLQIEVKVNTALVCPMGLGNHIDHQAVFLAGKQSDRIADYYADYPYILDQFDNPHLTKGIWQKSCRHLSENALNAWQEAVLCHQSQLSGFWRDEEEVRLSLRNFLAGGGGRLWRKQTS